MNYNSIIKYCLSLSYYDLQDYAENYFKIVSYYFQKNIDDKPYDVLIETIFTCIAVDGKLTNNEYDFIKTITNGYNFKTSLNIIDKCNNLFYQDKVIQLANLFPDNVKDAFIKMCLAILCVDENVDKLETCFINRLIK